ncbi:MAG: transposase [Nitrospirota bacterium]
MPEFAKISTRNQRKKNKSKRQSKKHQEYIKRERARAARIKAKREKHRRKHPQQEMHQGMMIILARYIIMRVKLREYLSCISLKKKPNSMFSVIDMIVGLVALMAFGIRRVYDVAKYQEHKLLARALQLDRMFSPCTAYRFLKEFGILTICRSLQKANSKMICSILAAQKEVVVDGDWSTLRSYPNQKEGAVKGNNKLRPGRPCYQASAYFANGFYIKASVLAGNQVPLQPLALLTDLKEVRRLCGHIDWIRLDAGYQGKEKLQNLDNFSWQGNSRKKVKFIISIGSAGIGFKYACKASRFRVWHRVKKGVFIQDFDHVQVYQGDQKYHRLILVRRFFEQEQKWKHYALVTNDTEQDAIALYRFYHKRQGIEGFFDDAKNSYFIEHLPSSQLLGNSLYFNIVCFAFNVLILFRHEVLRKKDHWMQLKTLQKKYLDLDLTWDGTILTISRSLPIYRCILMILQRLEKLNIALEYRLCG